MSDEDFILEAGRAGRTASSSEPQGEPIDVEPLRHAVRQAEANALEEQLLDEVARHLYPMFLQEFVGAGLATVAGVQTKWNMPKAALTAYQAAEVLVKVRRRVLPQFKAGQNQ